MKRLILLFALAAFCSVARAHADVPLPEYPRPQMVRPEWSNLNGLWSYAILNKDDVYETPQGKILVPFAAESRLSGVQKQVGPEKALWYQRSFAVPKQWKGKRVLLNFGAVDWQAEVWVNDNKAGVHTGGYSPFSMDITDLLRKKGPQDLKVKVTDASDQSWQPRGKQVAHPRTIWYTSVTGIWQTVWLEAVPQARVVSYLAEADVDKSSLNVHVDSEGLRDDDLIRVELREGGVGYSAEKPSGKVIACAYGTDIVLQVDSPELWSPSRPYLYGLDISILRDDKVIDKVSGYTALRKISAKMDTDTFETSGDVPQGSLRLALNNEILFQFGPLDQGWWPDGLYTAPSDQALRFDIEKTKEWGFNMIRKHIKVEPARWYYWCDVLGVLVWQDMPCIADHSNTNGAFRSEELGAAQKNIWALNSFRGGTDCIVPDFWKKNYYKEWGEIIECLRGFPCIVVWVPFNEGWGQFDTEDVVRFTKKMDPSRLVNEASGGNFHLAGDILDVHHYPEPRLNIFDRTKVNVLGEYGGIGYLVEGHVWQPEGQNWGYSGLCKSEDELLDLYRLYADRLKTLIDIGCAAAVYTQTTDVELELNGLMTYDRQEKVDVATLRAINQDVIDSQNVNWIAKLGKR
ncbi:MAG: beta-galactosidase [Bacteroidales bacterium]|nr:beta-galactosidase [Bacteroidales bacterium]